MRQPAIHRAQSSERLARDLADAIGGRLQAALQDRGEAGLIVPGGATPGALFDCLGGLELAWTRVAVTLCDERLVAADSPDSNEGLVRRRLLQGRAAAARFIPLTLEDPLMRAFPWPADVAVVGMGEDAHTASWFPGAAELDEALTSARTLVRLDPPHAAHARLTLTAHRLCAARYIAVLITGARKLEVLADALAGDDARIAPIRAILACTQAEVFWAP